MDYVFDDVLAAVGDDEIIDLEKRLISIPSYTTEEQQLAEYIADFLRAERIEVEMQPVHLLSGGRSRRFGKKSYNVIARIRGRDDDAGLLNGHMDHGPIPGSSVDDLTAWLRPPFSGTVEDGYIYGKGAQDEKGGICAMLTALVSLARVGVSLRKGLIAAPVCCHKTFGIGTRYLLNAGIRSSMAINTENTGNAIVTSHVGVFKAQIKVRGANPHPAARLRHHDLLEAPTPFAQALKLIKSFGPETRPYREDSWLRFKRHPQLVDFPWHHIEEIDSNGASESIVLVWWRTPPGVTERSLEGDLERLIGSIRVEDPSFEATFKIEAFGEALETPVSVPLAQSLTKWQKAMTGKDARVGPEGRYGKYGDAAVLAAAGIETVAYGPGGGLSDLDYDHSVLRGEIPPDERIRIDDLVTAARVVTLTAVDLLRA